MKTSAIVLLMTLTSAAFGADLPDSASYLEIRGRVELELTRDILVQAGSSVVVLGEKKIDGDYRWYCELRLGEKVSKNSDARIDAGTTFVAKRVSYNADYYSSLIVHFDDKKKGRRLVCGNPFGRILMTVGDIRDLLGQSGMRFFADPNDLTHLKPVQF